MEPTINGTPIRLDLDTGSARSIILDCLYLHNLSRLPLSPTSVVLKPCSVERIKPLGGHLCGRQVKRPTPRRQGSRCKDRRTATVWTRLAAAHQINLEPCASPRQKYHLNTAPSLLYQTSLLSTNFFGDVNLFDLNTTWDSFSPTQHKINLLRGLTNRIPRICSQSVV